MENVKAGNFVKIYDPSIGESEPWYINDHAVAQGLDGTWHLFGITNPEPINPINKHLAHATADSLTQQMWVKQPFALETDWENWREVHLWAPHVVYHDGLFYMFYAAGDPDHARYKIHLVTSKDLWTWGRHPENPMVVDGYDARDPMVLRVGDIWVMYYTATSRPEGGNHIVAYRTSRDLVHWSKRGVAFTDPSQGTWGGPTESPFVVRRGSYYYLFIGPRGGYVGTDVFASQDPFHWDPEDLVGHIESHAAEVIQDEDGRWYITSAGWGQGGVYLAPLEWSSANR